MLEENLYNKQTGGSSFYLSSPQTYPASPPPSY